MGELVDEHDVVVLWGLTMPPHFDPPFDAVRLFAGGVARVLGENGVFLIEDMDRVYWVMYRAGYKRFLVEGRKGDRTIASMHEGYDFVGGTFRRGYYVLPGFRKVGTVDFHYWDISTQLALGRIFFGGEYGLVKREDHGIAGVGGDVLIFKKPKGGRCASRGGGLRRPPSQRVELRPSVPQDIVEVVDVLVPREAEVNVDDRDLLTILAPPHGENLGLWRGYRALPYEAQSPPLLSNSVGRYRVNAVLQGLIGIASGRRASRGCWGGGR